MLTFSNCTKYDEKLYNCYSCGILKGRGVGALGKYFTFHVSMHIYNMEYINLNTQELKRFTFHNNHSPIPS